jgi:hypothetical protein
MDRSVMRFVVVAGTTSFPAPFAAELMSTVTTRDPHKKPDPQWGWNCWSPMLTVT